MRPLVLSLGSGLGSGLWRGLCLCLCATAPAYAAGDEHSGGIATLLWQAGNLVLLVGFLFFVARKPVRSYFAQRREQIQSELRDASEVLSEAEQRFAEWESKLAALDTEVELIRATAAHRAREEREHILSAARQAAERIRRDASAAVDQELRRARAELREEAADLAIELADSLLREQVSASDRKRLIDEFISRVEQDASC